MTSDARWRQVRDLFEQAVEDAPADVEAWLDAHGAIDRALREEIVSLLAHHSRAGSFMAQPVADRLPELLDNDSPAEVGQTVGPYTIERELGHGGMGHVYLASDGRLGRPVALKALRPALTRDPAHRERLRREARAAGALAHPGICTIYALEEYDGQIYIAAEFIDGRTLRAEMEEGVRPSPDAVRRTLTELAEALASAHARGITHRDLKPDNVMRARDGRLKILDFGLASLESIPHVGDTSADASPRITQPGTLLGTPAYMAPEQLNGEVVDARADVFALGMLAYEYATGTHPFTGSTTLSVAARILESEAVPLDRQRHDLPEAVVDVVGRCLRKTPADRFANAAEVARALITGAGTGAAAGRRPTAWWRTHQLAVVAVYLVACGLAWQIKEWAPGVTTAVFVAACVAATAGGVLRLHLLFAERVAARGLAGERARAAPATLVTDLLLGVLLVADGMLLTGVRPLAAALTIALGVGIALVRVVVEPSTTAATFEG